MKLRPKNWGRFQHYKDRRPPWIKLYRTLLDDRVFMCLPVASKALAPLLWLVASDDENGEIQGELADLAFRVRMTEAELSAALKPLISNGLFEDASIVLADRLQVATPETERETETETEKPPLIPPLQGDKPKRVVSKGSRATVMPETWAPNPATHHRMAHELGVSVFDEMDKFRDFHQSRGNRFVNWDQAFNNWLRNAAEFKARKK